MSAKINGVGGFLTKSPDVYVEFDVDSEGQAKRTAVKKKTSSPQWDQTFTINVKESSIVEFKVICKAKVFDDTIMGSKSVKVSSWLKKDSTNGKCKYFYQFFLILVENSKFIIQLVGRDNSKAGELKVSLSGTVERTKCRNTASGSRIPDVNNDQPSTSTGFIASSSNGIRRPQNSDPKSRDTIMASANPVPEEPLPEGWELRYVIINNCFIIF